jgi:hypothetical protein
MVKNMEDHVNARPLPKSLDPPRLPAKKFTEGILGAQQVPEVVTAPGLVKCQEEDGEEDGKVGIVEEEEEEGAANLAATKQDDTAEGMHPTKEEAGPRKFYYLCISKRSPQVTRQLKILTYICSDCCIKMDNPATIPPFLSSWGCLI